MRRMVSDNQQVFRVIVVQFKRVKNPAYVQGGTERYYALTDEKVETAYGPYNSIGAAKAVLTRETVDMHGDGAPRWGVVGGRIERAETTWTQVVP